MSKNSIAGKYATCIYCTTIFEKKHLNDRMQCLRCEENAKKRRELALSRANANNLSTAARKILVDMNRKRGEPVSPEVSEAFLNELGGATQFGQMIADEFKKSRGQIDQNNPGHYKPNQRMTLKWAELMSRVALSSDQIEESTISQLTDEELVTTLRGLAFDLVKSNSEFRRLIAIEAVKEEPALIQELMTEAGCPVVEPSQDQPKLQSLQSPEKVQEEPNLLTAGLDEEDAGSASNEA